MTDPISTKSEPNPHLTIGGSNEHSKKWRRLHQEWIHWDDCDVATTGSNSQHTSEDTAVIPPHEQRQKPKNPLFLARMWIKSQEGTLSSEGDVSLLRRFLWFLILQPKSGWSLRHIEWQIVLLLELHVRTPKTLLDSNFSKVYSQYVRKRVNRKKKSSAPTHQDFPSYLVSQLCHLACRLPPSTHLGAYLGERILTSYMWKRIPSTVSTLFDAFELDNPYLSSTSIPENAAEVNPSVLEICTTTQSSNFQSKKRKSSLVSSSENIKSKPSQRRFPTLRRNANRLNHFHSQLHDVRYLLEQKKAPTPALSRNVDSSFTAMNAIDAEPRVAPNTPQSRHRSCVETPQSSKTKSRAKSNAQETPQKPTGLFFPVRSTKSNMPALPRKASSSTNKRSASITVAAARSFLQRNATKSLL